jgi:hypothetical protein
VIHFDAGATTAVAHQSNAYALDDCGRPFTIGIDWTATLPTF